MSTALYDLSIPVLDKALAGLDHVYKKGEAYAEEAEIAPEVLLQSRLFPNMLPLISQMRIAASLSKAYPFRATGQTPPVYEDDETSFADVYATIAKARKDIASISADEINGQEDFEFTVKLGPRGDVPFTSISYLQGFTLPNVYFHCTTAYNILRHNGVPLGKFDFFGG